MSRVMDGPEGQGHGSSRAAIISPSQKEVYELKTAKLQLPKFLENYRKGPSHWPSWAFSNTSKMRGGQWGWKSMTKKEQC